MRTLTTLQQELQALKQAEPRLRSRDLAHKMGISEAELLGIQLGEHIVRLEGDWKELLLDVKEMGYVMALTRNEYCVHERKGVYDNIKFFTGHGNMGVAVNPDIDLRFFMDQWKYAFAVTMKREKGKDLHGFQFFNARGEAVHKIYTTPKSEVEAYHGLVEKYLCPEQLPLTDVDHSEVETKTELADSEIDVDGFQQEWLTLKDTHDFFPLLRKHELSRTQAFRLAPEDHSMKIDNQAVVRMLSLASERGVSIMCFLHSKGCIQIHTGEVKNLKFYGEWYNVMDPKFNLHLNLPEVHESWIIKKPTEDGIVTSLELFDKNGQLIVYFFGARKPGIPELDSWRQIIEDIQHTTLETVN
ncbi:MAG: ChuX/HutX family heme-like substrate-binding protein [Bacteroidota bacterium]